jgi:hypothetical protein
LLETGKGTHGSMRSVARWEQNTSLDLIPRALPFIPGHRRFGRRFGRGINATTAG